MRVAPSYVASASLAACLLAVPFAAQSKPAGLGSFVGKELPRELVPADPSAAIDFGRNVALDGNRAVVTAGPSAAAYVFEFDGAQWVEETKLVAWDGGHLGSSVAICGDRIVVGATAEDGVASHAGAVYAFRRSNGTWQPDGKLVASDGQSGDAFGHAVALDGTRLVVSALYGESPFLGDDIGKLYVFEGARGWTETAKIDLPGGGYGSDGFGYSLALEGDTLAVGAPYHKVFGHDRGRAFLFEHDGSSWNQAGVVDTIGEFGQRYLGDSVALDGDVLIVGAPGDGASSNFNAAGAVYVHRRVGGSWTFETKIAPDDTFWDEIGFGNEVAVAGGQLWIGSRSSTEGGVLSGSVYLYEETRIGWARVEKTNGSADFDFQGYALAAGEGFALVGSPGMAPGEGAVAQVPFPTERPTLVSSPSHVDFHVEGDVHRMLIEFGPELAGQPFAVYGTTSGTSPGTVIDGVTVPINSDGYTFETITTPGSTHLVGASGILDAKGRASVAYVVPPGGLDFSLTEMMLHHAAVAFDAVTGDVIRASEATSLGIVY